MSSVQERVRAAATFLLQAPPGEVNDCFNDVKAIVADDQALEEGVYSALEQYNCDQFTVVQLQSRSVLITTASQLSKDVDGKWKQGRHVDPRSQKTFHYDHIKSVVSDPQDMPVDQETESHRSAIEKLLTSYVENHYNDGVSQVYALEDSNYPSEPVVDESRPPADDESAEMKEVAEEVKPMTTAVSLEDPLMDMAGSEKAEQSPDSGIESAPKEASAVTSEMSIGSGITSSEVVGALNPDKNRNLTDYMKEESTIENSNGDVDKKETSCDVTTVSPASKLQSQPVTKSRKFGLYFVGNKYNPSNYWTGRWRSVYVIDLAEGTLTGTVRINVHYYEQGNVQLTTTLQSESSLSTSPSPVQIIASLKSSEQSIQSQLSEAYDRLSGDVFKGLRRALPKTRSKIDWGKVSGYRLGSELGGAVTGLHQ